MADFGLCHLKNDLSVIRVTAQKRKNFIFSQQRLVLNKAKLPQHAGLCRAFVSLWKSFERRLFQP